MVRYTNLGFLNHLNCYDVINKFNYLSCFNVPVLNKLSFKIFLKGFINPTFLNVYLKNFFLLYLYCVDNLYTNLQFIKIRKKKLKFYRAKLFISYSLMKSRMQLSLFNLIFIFKKFARPLYFSIHNVNFSLSSGRPLLQNHKIITFLPGITLLDTRERKIFLTLRKAKVFLTLTIKNILSNTILNFFNSGFKASKKKLKNFLLLWYLV